MHYIIITHSSPLCHTAAIFTHKHTHPPSNWCSMSSRSDWVKDPFQCLLWLIEPGCLSLSTHTHTHRGCLCGAKDKGRCHTRASVIGIQFPGFPTELIKQVMGVIHRTDAPTISLSPSLHVPGALSGSLLSVPSWTPELMLYGELSSPDEIKQSHF